MTIINPVALPPFTGQAYNAITPFTYRDGLTFVEVLEGLRGYITKTIVPAVDGMGEFVDAKIVEVIEAVDEALVEQDEQNAVKITQLTTYVNDTVASIIDNSIEVQDPLVAQLVENLESQTGAALSTAFVTPVVEVAGDYPETDSLGTKIFIGEENPGLEMGDADIWASPDSATMSDIVTAVANPNHPLYSAIQVLSTPTRFEFGPTDFASVGNTPVVLTTLNPGTVAANSLPVLQYADGVVSVGGRIWRSPVGWNACRVYFDWAHRIQPTALNGTPVTWQARLSPYTGQDFDMLGTQATQNLTIASPMPTIRKVQRVMFAGNFNLNPAGAEMVLSAIRLNAPATSDGTGNANLVKVILERTA